MNRFILQVAGSFERALNPIGTLAWVRARSFFVLPDRLHRIVMTEAVVAG